MAAVGAHAAALTSGQARALAATCLTCHNPVRGQPTFAPRLEGTDATRLANVLRAYRSGEHGSLVMRQLARGYTEAEIAALADWFAAQPRR
ncbi:MAG TPA: cytochrome c [Casimicrobiaceae bacterium]|nr:cytochrome c [Casimicrobiaceae bacterium]